MSSPENAVMLDNPDREVLTEDHMFQPFVHLAQAEVHSCGHG